ncbi:T9SS type B sorting domain-containing protein [Leeuwenhoekiella parthenopeia]|uniref:T9SS type B sorting domain-containing protein n=1 Tax=Leeuwenhoekiella parthenopeia TaxID=2890320 RepID=A0ABS8GRW1_9FLAO|nr:T9SS type B sorting domain-containing protein [Leeuwenhoekiella parthenopeia]
MLRAIAIILFCVVLTPVLQAQTRNSAYLSLSDGSIVLANFDDCTVEELIGPGSFVMFDIAEGPTNRTLYGIFGATLFLIDLDAGVVNQMGNLTSSSGPLRSFNSLVKDTDGSLLAVTDDISGSLFRIDPNTLEATFLGATNYPSGGDLSFIEGDLYLSALNDNLVKVNIADPPSSVLVGNMNDSGFSFVFGVVSVVSGEPCTGNIDYTMIATGAGSVRTVNIETGQTQELCTNLLNSQAIFGAAEVSVSTICSMSLDLQPVSSVCAGEIISISTQISPEEAFGSYTYEWYKEGDTSVLGTAAQFTGSFDETTTLRCIVTDTDRVGEFRSVEASLTVEVNQKPVIDAIEDFRVVETFTFPEITGDNLPESVLFYTDERGQGDAYSTGDEIRYSARESYPLTFFVYAENESFCNDEISFQVSIISEELSDSNPISAPLFFTPNGDGYHDSWQIQIAGDVRVEGVYIFDRFGKLLKQLDTSNPSWDGTYRGKQMPATDYWYLISYRQGDSVSELKGNFTLKR